MSFKGFIFLLILALVVIFSAERNHFSNFGRGSPKKHFCETILKSGHWMSFKVILFVCCFFVFFFSILSPGGYFVQRSETISNFGRESPKEHFCEIILKSVHWPKEEMSFKGFFFLFLALKAILFSGGEPF